MRHILIIMLVFVTLAAADSYLPLIEAEYVYSCVFEEEDGPYLCEESRWTGLEEFDPEDDYSHPPWNEATWCFDDLAHQVFHLYLRDDGDSLRFVEFYCQIGEWGELPWRIELPIEAGASWSEAGYEATIEEVGSYSVPVGEFEDCLRLSYSFVGKPEFEMAISHWSLIMAPEVGVIAESAERWDGYAWEAELVEYSILE